jgi:predicted CoA-substrate-specific enzyme activase
MEYYLGIDIGSGTSKGVLRSQDRVAVSCSLPSGLNYVLAAQNLLTSLLAKAGVAWSEVKAAVATGCGAGGVKYATSSASDIRCCARGVCVQFPAARTVIDIEGQSTRLMRLAPNGQVADFSTSEKCASGSGRFIDIISNVLQIPMTEIGPLSLQSKNPVTFSTSCAVFGESEAISRVADGVSAADILAGVHKAMAEKIAGMLEKTGLEEPCVVCGGGALNVGLVQTLESLVGLHFIVPAEPVLVTALGAAVLAEELAKAQKAEKGEPGE